MTNEDPDELAQQLLARRPSNLPGDLSDILYTDENWIRMKVDVGHVQTLGDGVTSVYRAIDLSGRLMWIFRSPHHRHCFPSRAYRLNEAAQEEAFAVRQRAEISAEWPRVLPVLDGVGAGRIEFEVYPEDGVAGGLAETAIEAFLERHGLDVRHSLPAAGAYGMIEIEPLVAFAIYAAWLREGSPFPGR